MAKPKTFTDKGQVANQPFLIARLALFKSAVVGSNAVESGPFENRELGDPRESISGAGSPRSAALVARCLRFFRSLREARGTPYSLLFQGVGPTDNFHELGSNCSLARAVVLEREAVDHLGCVLGGRVHGGHARAEF